MVKYQVYINKNILTSAQRYKQLNAIAEQEIAEKTDKIIKYVEDRIT